MVGTTLNNCLHPGCMRKVHAEIVVNPWLSQGPGSPPTQLYTPSRNHTWFASNIFHLYSYMIFSSYRPSFFRGKCPNFSHPPTGIKSPTNTSTRSSHGRKQWIRPRTLQALRVLLVSGEAPAPPKSSWKTWLSQNVGSKKVQMDTHVWKRKRRIRLVMLHL